MPTVKHMITTADGWVEIAADGVDFLLEAYSNGPIKLTLQDTAPSADAAHYLIKPYTAIVRVGTGAAYIATDSTDPSTVIVST